LAVAALIALLTGVVVCEIVVFAAAEPDLVPALQTGIGPSRAPIGPAPEVPAASWVATALERLLFRENRRPAEEGGDSGRMDKTVRLTGVMTGLFGNRAIFVAAGESKPIVVREGGRVSDFIVRSIGASQTVVETPNGLRTLRPSFSADGSPLRR